MGEEDMSDATPAPAVTVDRKPGSQIGLALTVLALVLASNSIINESWLDGSVTDGDDSATVDISLTELSVELCDGDDCDQESENFGTLYDDCIDRNEGESSSAKEKACGDFADFHNSGLVAMILLIIAAVILLVSTILQVRSMTGSSSKVANIFSGISGIWVAITILIWYLMLPDTDFDIDLDPDWGQGLWMATIAAICGLVAGFSGKIQSWIDGPARTRAHGVRAGTGMKEFILKESSCGNTALSILADSDLIRVARVTRVGASSSVEDILATRRDSYTGFSHQRLDWLDDFKGVWWVLAGASLISSFMISTLFLIPFSIAALLALLQLMDPERFVVSTNSGNHPFYINRWRSNRELTDLAMDLVDDAMIAVLRGEDLETEKLDARADLIANRFSVNMKARQMAERLAAAEKEAKRQAAEAAAAAQQMAMMQAQQMAAEQQMAMMQAQQMPMAQAPDSQPNQQTPPGMQNAMMSNTQMPMQSEASPVENQESVETPDEEVQEAQEEETEPNLDENSDDSSNAQENVEDNSPAAVEDEAESVNSESEETNSEVEEKPQTVTEEEPVAISPPPSTPTMIPPPPTGPPLQQAPMPPIPAPPAQSPVAIPAPPAMPMPQPPGPAMMPPPPGMVGAPGPLPPMGNPILPPMATPQPTSPPPPVLVQASPREENLTDDEKDDLLGDLNE